MNAKKQNDVLVQENRHLKSRLEQLERENKLLKKSLFDLSLRMDLAQHRLAQQQPAQQQQQQQQPHQSQQQQSPPQAHVSSPATRRRAAAAAASGAVHGKHLVLDSVLSSASASHNNSSLTLDELDTRETLASAAAALPEVLALPDGDSLIDALVNDDDGGGGGDGVGDDDGFADDADGDAPARSRSSIRQSKLSQLQLQLHCTGTLQRHEGAVHCAVFAPDGAALASVGFDKLLRVWRPAASGDEWALSCELRGHALAISDVRWAPQSPLELATSAFDSTVRRWSLRSGGGGGGECVATHSLGRRGIVQSLAYSRSEPTLVFGGSTSGALLAFDARSAAHEPSVLADGTAVINAVADVDGVVLATGDAMGRLRLWDRRSAAQPLAEARGTSGEPISHVAVSDALDRERRVRLLAINSYDNAMRVYRASAAGVRRPLVTIEGLALRNWPIRCAFYVGESFNLSERVGGLAGALCVASGGADNVASVSELSDVVRAELLAPDDTGTAVASVQQRLAGHTDRVYSVDVHPRANLLATASADGTVRLWAPPTTTPTHHHQQHASGKRSAGGGVEAE